MRLAWITDPHLDHADRLALGALVARVRSAGADVVAIGGDIGQADTVTLWLKRMHAALGLPLYFVLGNHDYYGGSIAVVQRQVTALCAGVEGLHWLPAAGPVDLGECVTLLGHGGWADGRAGDFMGSRMMLNDYRLIQDLVFEQREDLAAALGRLGDEAARWAEHTLPLALERGRDVLLLTHAPPFEAACWHEGGLSDAQASPHFTDKALGGTLLAVMACYPQRQLTVLCGHTHSAGFHQAATNLRVITAGATYGQPGLAGLLDL